MKLDIFIKRPVLASGISILIVLLGLIGLFTLPVEQYPDMAPPTVVVNTEYPGANAQTVQNTVIMPLEESINGVEDMTYMYSTATGTGRATITIYFRPGTDADMAAVNVQNRVAAATAQLPAEVNQMGVTTRKQQSGMLLQYVVYSPDESFDMNFLANYLKINVDPQLLRVPGVSDVNSLGTEYSMRIWLKPDVMAQYGLEPADIVEVLGEQNIEAATGQLGQDSENTFQYSLNYTGRLESEEEFEQMVIRALPDGRILRVGDIATVELGSTHYLNTGGTDGKPSIFSMVYQMPGSNATEVINQVVEALEKAQADMPPGMEILIVENVNEFLSASISNVVKTLIEAILLVVLVVFIFLQNVRSTMIPVISIVVSLIGTFAFLSVAGFTINLLTLFALVLVIGTVVDDSIVVVEAVQSRFDAGYRSPFKATRDGMKGISKAVITCSLVFMAVFIPVSFIGGATGTFYTQFGITMAVAVGISAINALTLCPALCVLMMRPSSTEGRGVMPRLRRAYNAAYGAMLGKYQTAVGFFIRRKWMSLATVVVAVAGLAVLMTTTKTGFVPNEDLGSVRLNVSAPPGSSLHTTDLIQQEIYDLLKDIPEIESYSNIAGFGLTSGQGPSNGNGLIRLKPWDERPGKGSTASAVVDTINARLATIKSANAVAFTPPMIPGYGNSNGFELYVQDRSVGSMNDLYTITQDFITRLNDRPEISAAYSTFSPNFPQFEVEVDAAKAKLAGVSPDAVLRVIQGYVGGLYASDFNRFNKIYQVRIQAAAEDRLDEHSLDNMFVRVGDQMAPVSQFASLKRIYGPQNMHRFNMFGSIMVSGQAAEGYSSGDAIAAIEEVAAMDLPQGYGYDFGGISRTEQQSTNTTGIILALAIIFIYLILSMLYESYLIPFAVLFSVPFGLAGSFLFAKIGGLENNIYLQMGLIMLIGLLSKTAILLTEYASERRAEGMSIVDAAMSAAKERLRPILMTALTMIAGLLPMMLSTGVGANGNRSLGTGVVGGMTIGTLALLFIVPALFIVFQTIQEKFKRDKSHDDEEEEPTVQHEIK